MFCKRKMTNAPRLNERILSFFVQHYVRNGEPIFERVVNTTLVRIIFLHRRYIKCLPFLQNSKKSQVELVIRGSELLCALFNEWRTANENGKLLIMMINRLYEHVRDLRYKIFVSHAVRPRMKLVYQVGRALKNTNRDCEILNYTNRTCDKVLLDLLSPNMTTVSATGLNVPPFIHYEDDKTFEKVQVFSYVPTTFALRNPYLGPFFAIPAKNMELPQAGLNVLYEYLPLPEMPLLETLTVGFKCIETSPPPSTKLYTQIMEGLKLAAPNLKDLALRYRLLIDSRKISKHLQQLELVMSKVKYLAEGIQLSKINSSGIVMDFEFSTVIENHTFDHCKSEFQRILQTDRFDWLNNDDDFEEGLERRTFEATVFMYEVPVKVTILVAQSQWLDPNMDLLEKICEPI